MHTELNTLEDLYYELIDKFSPEFSNSTLGVKLFDISLKGIDIINNVDHSNNFISLDSSGKGFNDEYSIIIHEDCYELYKGGSFVRKKDSTMLETYDRLTVEKVVIIFRSIDNLF